MKIKRTLIRIQLEYAFPTAVESGLESARGRQWKDSMALRGRQWSFYLSSPGRQWSSMVILYLSLPGRQWSFYLSSPDSY